MIFIMSEVETIMYAIAKRILELAPAAALITPDSRAVIGKGLEVTVSLKSGFYVISFNTAS